MPVAAAIARTSSCTGLPCVTPQRASGWPMRAASWRVSVVSRPARPGATSFGPPEKPAKKCGSTNPVVMRTSASTHSLFSHTGTSAPKRPIQVSDAASRASWLTTRTAESTSSPSIARSSSSAVAAVRAGRDEHDDVLETHEPLELLEQRRHDDLARLRARAVADADRDRRVGRARPPAAAARRPAGAAPRGRRRARRARPADAAARRPSCGRPGRSTVRPSLPYASSTFTTGARAARAG